MDEEITVEATVENIARVTEFVDGLLERYECPVRAQMHIDIAIDELFGNIARYAYNPETGSATVRVEVTENPLQVLITFIDKGVPFDPLAKEDPDVSLALEDRGVGGLGIFMAKKTMDDVAYEYVNGCNILRITKTLE